MREFSAPVSHWMIDAIAPQPGERVLELAAGLGETGMLAAELVAPMGGVIVSDQAEAMLAGARERAVALGLSNVEFQVLNAEWIDLPVASVDAVLCRWGYMLMADPLAALTRDAPRAAPRRAHRARRVGLDRAQPLGALALGGSCSSVALAAPAGSGHAGSVCRWAVPSAVRELLEQAGFAEVRVEAVDLRRRHASFEELWESTLDLSRALPRRGARSPRAGDRRDRCGGGASASRPTPPPMARSTSPVAPSSLPPARSRPRASAAASRPSRPPARKLDSLRQMLYDDDADLTSSTARPSRSSATAPRATPTRST